MLQVRPLLMFGLLVASLAPGLAIAQPLTFENAWSPEAPPVAPVMAGYVRISNDGSEDVSLTGAHCSDFARVEIHDMVERDGMMRMIKQESLTIPAGKQVELKPGSLHMMLMKPRRAIKRGETLEITFETASGESIPVTFEVKPQSARDQQHDNHQHHHH
ncbi:MAG: copper chaperone PCu(A)C [Thiohalophilus sp.]|uniref:copper chaperone PCu(A)C n=1 Tax=Thiohalophilus sp. TaxID=3028392 RepID=UPI002870190D|nr:copper chaperone PCu(A)C [Thiohalophilus sp.]MDR9436018.1 copper chaperone PCu(A)C [Thiohalophilus sp.]